MKSRRDPAALRSLLPAAAALSILAAAAPARAGETEVNAAIQGPAGTALALPAPESSGPVDGDTDVEAFARVLVPQLAAPAPRAGSALIVRLADETGRWAPMVPVPVTVELALPASVAVAPVPASLASAWPGSVFGILTTPTQICVVERASRRIVLVVDRSSLVATEPRTRIIYVSTGRKSRLVAVDLAHAVDRDITFEPGSARLTREARAQLVTVGAALQSPALRTSRFLVSGHTSAKGDALSNRELSFRRAVAVRDYLARTFGIARDRIQVFGFGADRLKYPAAPFEPANGRVEIATILGGGA